MIINCRLQRNNLQRPLALHIFNSFLYLGNENIQNSRVTNIELRASMVLVGNQMNHVRISRPCTNQFHKIHHQSEVNHAQSLHGRK